MSCTLCVYLYVHCRVIFPHCKKSKKEEEIVHKRYIMSKNEYMFGPLHCGKNRERYKEGLYPENMESLTISNEDTMEVEVSFFFQKDMNATTFLLEPPTMKLKGGESQVGHMEHTHAYTHT